MRKKSWGYFPWQNHVVLCKKEEVEEGGERGKRIGRK